MLFSGSCFNSLGALAIIFSWPPFGIGSHWGEVIYSVRNVLVPLATAVPDRELCVDTLTTGTQRGLSVLIFPDKEMVFGVVDGL